jgi:rod shape-determining protein MreC
MDTLLNRYRSLTVLLLVIFAQLVLLAYQVRSNQDVRLIRVWAVTAVTPLAKVADLVRSGTIGVLENYILLHDVRAENSALKRDVGRLKVDNEYLKSELATADRIKALSAFQTRSPSRTLAVRVIGAGTGANSRVYFVDHGSRSGVMRGMAVITPDGIVGKVIAAYPTASQVLLITDPTFAAGVISQKRRVRGTVRGSGNACVIDYVQNEEQVEPGEWFYTSGDDGVFPKGLPVGTVTVVRPGPLLKQVFLAPSGLQGGLEEVLIVTEGVHQPIPEGQSAAADVHLQPAPPAEPASSALTPVGTPTGTGTEADRMRDRYRKLGEAQGHVFGEGLPGSTPPNFNLTPEETAARAAARAAKAQAAQPPAGGAPAPAPAKPPAAKPPVAEPKPAPAAGAPRI